MPFTVAVLDEVGYGSLDSARATELCEVAFSLRRFDTERIGELSVALVNEKTIRELNLKYRGMDRATDVLSFEMDGLYGEMAGEVVVSPESASPEMGVEELVVHGALHLSGMDHGEDFGSSEMCRVQAAIMEKVRDGEE